MKRMKRSPGYSKAEKQERLDALKKRPIKCILLGNSNVGKSSILLRFYLRYFKPGMDSTVGVDFVRKNVYIQATKFEMHVWDTAGQERFCGITRGYFKGLDVCLLIFDLT